MYAVSWKQSAVNESTNLWLQGDSATRQAITTAMNQIDRALERDPENYGESRGGGLRIAFEFPLGVRFEVDRQKKVVHVLQVWSYRRRGQATAQPPHRIAAFSRKNCG